MTPFDPKTLSIDEMDLIEEHSGGTVGEVIEAVSTGRFSAKQLRAVGLVIVRRENPEATLEDVGKVTIADLSPKKA